MTEEISSAGKKVLLVDDDREILASVSAAMSQLGYDVSTACNGNDGATMADEVQPNLVILDQMMPGKSGLLVLEKIKRGKDRENAPKVIMITANQGHRHKSYAESLGVDAYLNKPFRMERLVETVEKLLEEV